MAGAPDLPRSSIPPGLHACLTLHQHCVAGAPWRQADSDSENDSESDLARLSGSAAFHFAGRGLAPMDLPLSDADDAIALAAAGSSMAASFFSVAAS